MRTSAGFTLLELLVGAVVSAVLLAALYSILNGVLGLQSTSRAALEKTLPEAGAMALIKRDLADMVVPTGLLGDVVLGEERNESGVRRDTLEFCTTTGVVSVDMPYPAIQKVEYYLAQEEDNISYPSVQLMRAVTRNLLATDSEETRTARSILANVSSMEIEYYDGDAWTSSWDSTTAETVVPKAVRIRLTRDAREPGSFDYPEIAVFCEIPSVSIEETTDAPTAQAASGPVFAHRVPA